MSQLGAHAYLSVITHVPAAGETKVLLVSEVSFTASVMGTGMRLLTIAELLYFCANLFMKKKRHIKLKYPK